jgi:uncharacterized membrane protein YhaH (DUF805 family)
MAKPVPPGIFQFSGRRSARSYMLFQILSIFTVLATIMIGGDVNDALDGAYHVAVVVVFAGLIVLQVFILNILAAQRCRDFGWSGWCVLVALIPIVGFLFALALCVIPGTAGPNQFGSDPRDTA